MWFLHSVARPELSRLAAFPALGVALAIASPSAALPDLTAEILTVNLRRGDRVNRGDVVEGCARAKTGRTLVRYGLRTRNIGEDDLVIGELGCPDCVANPNASCDNPLYVCSAAHGHAHFEEYVRAQLLDAEGEIVAEAGKQGFCLLDSDCADGTYDCNFQGISAGCADVYDASLPCQYIDITEHALPPGDYSLQVTVDPDNLIAEADEGNNVATVHVTLSEFDHPLRGRKLLLEDPNKPSKRVVAFSSERERSLDVTAGGDPTSLGGLLSITGASPGDGATGPIELAASLWKPREEGPGFVYDDPSVASGVRKVVLRNGLRGGRIKIKGGGPNWPYQIDRPQSLVQVRLRVGDTAYCAEFPPQGAKTNRAGRASFGPSFPPARCAPIGCGDGRLNGIEECDDGNTADGDGCTSTCTLEDASAVCAGVPVALGTDLAARRILKGLTRPTHVASAPLDPRRLFIAVQKGRIRVMRDGLLRAAPFLDIRSKVACCGERGLLSVAFHPDYPNDPRFFVNYTREGDGATVISSFNVSADHDLADRNETVLRVIAQGSANHNGGQIAFGADGALYVGMGDGGGQADPNERAQDPSSLLGKLLRIDVDAPAPANPLDEIFASGLRNPFRFSFDPATGDLYLADVGQSQFEEINVAAAPIEPNLNYGWDVFEADACFEPDPAALSCPEPPDGFTFPVLSYGRSDGCSVTGGFVYRGCRMTDLKGRYFYSDFCTAFLRSFKGVVDGVAQDQLDYTFDLLLRRPRSINSVSSFGVDGRGELYIVDYGDGGQGSGEIYQLVPASAF